MQTLPLTGPMRQRKRDQLYAEGLGSLKGKLHS